MERKDALELGISRNGYSYPRLPRLPLEIIMQILIFAGDLLMSNTQDIETYSAGLEVRNHSERLLPQVILDPSILKPHYVDTIPPNSPLEDIASRSLKPSVLEDGKVSKYLKLYIDIKTSSFKLKMTRQNTDMKILSNLVSQVPRQWYRLELDLYGSSSTTTASIVNLCKPCFPYITSLSTQGGCSVWDPPLSAALASAKATVPGCKTRLSVRTQLSTLPTLINFGVLGGVVDLILESGGHLRDMTLPYLPEILTSMPCLEVFDYSDFLIRETFNLTGLPKIELNYLHFLRVMIFGDADNDVLTFLALFSNCPIHTLEVSGHTDRYHLEILGDYFPHLKELTYHECDDMEVLLTKKIRGNLPFPELEVVTFEVFHYLYGPDEKTVKQAELERVLKIVRIRTSTPEAVPLKRVRIDSGGLGLWSQVRDFEMVNGTSFEEELEKYVQVVDFLN